MIAGTRGIVSKFALLSDLLIANIPVGRSVNEATFHVPDDVEHRRFVCVGDGLSVQ